MTNKIKTIFKKIWKWILLVVGIIVSILATTCIVIWKILNNKQDDIDNSDIRDRKDALDEGSTDGVTNDMVDDWYSDRMDKRKNESE